MSWTNADKSSGSSSSKPLPPLSRRRDKPQLSCNLCRRRKLRCDRGQPCGSCTRRGLSLSCTYVLNEPQHSKQGQPGSMKLADMQDRLGQLESLVTSLRNSMNPINSQEGQNGSAPSIDSSYWDQMSLSESDRDTGTLPQDQSNLSDGLGHFSLDDGGVRFVESAHWTAILDYIADLKDSIHEPDENLDNPTASDDETEGLFTPCQCVDRDSILNAFPQKTVVDKLVTTFFNSMNIMPVVLHKATFLKEYDDFWNHPYDTSIMWIGMLFAVITLGTIYEHFGNIQNSLMLNPQVDSNFPQPFYIYRRRVIHCLKSGKFTKCPPYAMETLFLYLSIEHVQDEDSSPEHWTVFGLLIRMALRMGYHREPSESPNISPFQGEMRRRFWAVLYHLDVSGSAQIGLPRMLKDVDSDIAEPRNLQDEDLRESMIELPPPRPETDLTFPGFLAIKNRLNVVYGSVSDSTSSPRTPYYAEIKRLDEVLHQTYQQVPTVLHIQQMSQLAGDAVEMLLRRVLLAMLFHKTQCVLHRKYLIMGRNDVRYAYSHTSSVEAALRILDYQILIDQECQPGGRLHGQRWRTVSLLRQEFLLGTTILCLDLSYSVKQALVSGNASESLENEMARKGMKALEKSYWIWLRSSEVSKEAKKIAEAVKQILSKATNTRLQAGQPHLYPNSSNLSNPSNYSPEFEITGTSPQASDSAINYPSQQHVQTPNDAANPPGVKILRDILDSLPQDPRELGQALGSVPGGFNTRDWVSAFEVDNLEEALALMDPTPYNQVDANETPFSGFQ